MEKLGFFQSNLFTSFQKNVYIILWKEVESDCLAELCLRQRLQNFYDITSKLQSPITTSKKGGSKPNEYMY